MLVKNTKSGATETMRYGPAMAAVDAGTHTIVNIGENGKPKAEKAKAKPKADEK
ncbi:hypothetical protein VQ042_18115 [Aurantimonas sp. A2-1-M11]|uniref:hypothetical protein n=1 Tax=Aurantimonas sp. A2-1-M11 TaxID=3113712 RepID=UPI002F94D18C